MSQLDRPKFERYRLVKEEDGPETASTVGRENGPGRSEPDGGTSYTEYVLKSEFVALSEVVEALRRRVDMCVVNCDAKEGPGNGKSSD